MSKNIWFVLVALIAFTSFAFSSCSSGCPEGEREFNGGCIPISSDGDTSYPDGDNIVLPDGDKNTGDGDEDGDVTIDGDVELEAEGQGNCSVPFEVPLQVGQAFNKDGDIAGFSDVVSAAICGETVAEGVEIVAMLSLEPGEILTATFSGSAVDTLIYVLQAQCSDTASCVSEVVDKVGVTKAETLVFEAEAQGDYFIIMDTKSASPSGTYSFTLSLAEAVDGDEDGDTDEIIDGDETEVETDDSVDGDEEEEGNVTECGAFTLNVKQIPEDGDGLVIGNITDLHWEQRILHLAADDGTGFWLYDSVDEQGIPEMNTNATYFSENFAVGGITHNADESFLYYLDRTNQQIIEKITDAEESYSLGGDFGSEGAGLTRLDGLLYAVNSSATLFIIDRSGGSVLLSKKVVEGAGSLVGLTVAGSRLYLLDVVDSDSKIHEYDVATNTIVRTYTVGGKAFSGISYNSSEKIMWGLLSANRQIWTLTPDGNCPGWEY